MLDFASFINESNQSKDIKYVTSEDRDEDRVTITALLNGNKVGYVSSVELIDSYSYGWEDDFTEDEFDKLFPGSVIIRIDHIVVEDKFKGLGIGTELMKHIMDLMKKRGFNQFYLNASPMGFSGLRIKDLTKFYQKFGFKKILDQGHNVQMAMVLKK